jgi:hypothetical protein
LKLINIIIFSKKLKNLTTNKERVMLNSISKIIIKEIKIKILKIEKI